MLDFIEYVMGPDSKIKHLRNICSRLMTKYNRTDLSPLLLKFPYWNAISYFAVWQSKVNNYNEVEDSDSVVPVKLYKLIDKFDREDGVYWHKKFDSFDAAMIQYFKALKIYIEMDKI